MFDKSVFYFEMKKLCRNHKSRH